MRLTFVTPFAPYHNHLVERAAAQVEKQTVKCDFISVADPDRRGPAWARNQGVAKAKTALVTFLDADDLLDPTFAERMMEYWRPGRYAYCDFIMDGQHIQMCDCTDLWRGRNVDGSQCEAHNVVTSVIGRKTFEQLGGFDEKIGVLEDTEFWLKAISRGVCGIRVPYALMEYTSEGQFSAEIHSHPQFKKLLLDLYERNPNMGCVGCESTSSGMPEPKGARQEGDVLVMCTWGGNREHVGRVTGRAYPRNGNNMLAWVDPQDVEAAPDRYKIVEQVEPETEEDLNDDELPETPSLLDADQLGNGELAPQSVQSEFPATPPVPEYDQINITDGQSVVDTVDSPPTRHVVGVDFAQNSDVSVFPDPRAEVSDQRQTPDIEPSEPAQRTVDGDVNTDDAPDTDDSSSSKRSRKK